MDERVAVGAGRGDVALVAVRIRSGDGRNGGMGEVEVAGLPLGRRLREAGLRLLVGLIGGLLFLPVPLVHLFGVAVFLTMLFLAVRRLGVRQVVRGARGRCPSCHADGPLFVGLGGKRLRFPLETHCPGCQVSLTLESVP
jgi:hypothetical protein